MDQSQEFGFREAARMFVLLVVAMAILVAALALWLAALAVCFALFGLLGAIPGVLFLMGELVVAGVLQSKYDAMRERQKAARVAAEQAKLVRLAAPAPRITVVQVIVQDRRDVPTIRRLGSGYADRRHVAVNHWSDER